MSTSKVLAIPQNTYNLTEIYDKLLASLEMNDLLLSKLNSSVKILLKPNLLTARSPEECATTNPVVVQAVIRVLKKYGVSDISVGDSPAGKHDWKTLWDKTGMSAVAEEENVKLIPFEATKNINIPKTDKKIPVIAELNDFDIVISLPKLKSHLLTKITGAVKNNYGLIPGKAKSNFHGDYPAPRKMSEFIAEVYSVTKPDFVIMDAIECMEGEGPNSGSPKHAGMIFAGDDGVALDSIACKLFGYNSSDILTLQKATELGAGVSDYNNIKVIGDMSPLEEVKLKHAFLADVFYKIPEKLFFLVTYLVRCRPKVKHKECVKCNKCLKECSQEAIYKDSKGLFQVKGQNCILCMCCIEACPHKAIKLKRNPIMKLFYK